MAQSQGLPVHEAQGQWITPGLIDCHTHLVYGGNRVAEFEQRLCGASYEDIARAGGGIQSTMRDTRAASADSLYESAVRRLRCLMAEGVTTIEIKSGYGLELAAERRSLEVARKLGETLPITVKKTFLGLHSLPPEFAARRQQFVNEVSGPWLTALHAAGLVDAVDSFCEDIAFSVAETEQFLEAAQKLGLAAHVHAGQLSDMGARAGRRQMACAVGGSSRVRWVGRRAGPGRLRNGRGTAADRLFYLAANDAAADSAAAQRRRAACRGHRQQSGHLAVHVHPAGDEHGLQLVWPDARRSAGRRHAAGRACAGRACRCGDDRSRQAGGSGVLAHQPTGGAVLRTGRQIRARP